MPVTVFSNRPRFRTLMRSLLTAGLLSGCLAVSGNGLSAEPELADNPYGNYLSGLHALRSSDYATASVYLDAALRESPDNAQISLLAFQSNWRAGNLDRARELAAILVAETGRTTGLAPLFLGLEALKEGEYALADQLLTKAQRDPLSHVILPMANAWLMAVQDKREESFEALSRLRSVAKPIADIMEGKLHEYYGDWAAAEKAYLGGATDPMTLYSGTQRALVRTYLRQDRFDEARSLLSDMLARNPNAVELEDDMARLMRDKNLEPLTETPLQAVAEGTLLIAQGHNDWAVKMDLARLAVSLDPTQVNGILTVGQLLDNSGHYAQAIAMYERVPETDYRQWQSRIQTALSRFNMGEKIDAIDDLEEMALERPGQLGPLDALSRIHHSEAKYDLMLSALDRLVDRLKTDQPGHWNYYHRRGIALSSLDRWNDAEQDFLHALKLSPDQPDVLNYLGYSWVDQNINLDKALGMLHRAVELRRTGYIIDSLGWAYYRLGRYEDAVEELERAVFQEPMEPVINDHLGDAYWKVGRYREARFQWERVLGLDLEGNEEVSADEVARKLEYGLSNGG
ncbi:tetratricopeptide repeat protein [Aestuariispira insulae]|uniref:Pentatricopeptide repeat protein n=1 Tax=Aestuariispira insulae TaxID=1461337 RepID=A0A3D9HP59_9PROT|nr:tetratricopeptide repeat protein [Aestuariispira insulae]RED51267.1 pentatricopeptide repeat protein [Aestuariispira insulae]